MARLPPDPTRVPPDLTRVIVVPNGPLLVDGPVEVVLPDGTVLRSDRPVVAICACRRSKRYPFCDTSHRERARSAADGEGSGSSSEG